MKRHVSLNYIRCAAMVTLAIGLLSQPAYAQWGQVLFSDNFFTALTPTASTTDLNYNIGLAGGRQAGSLVAANPLGFGWSVFGKTEFALNNGWDLRAQTGFPVSGPVDTYTLRYRDNVASEWSTLTPDIGFESFIVNDSYRIQAQILHANPDLSSPAKNDRWAGITFGAQPEVRFPNVLDNAGIILFASGAYQVFADGSLVGFGNVTLSANAAFDMDIRVWNNIGSIFVNNSEIASGLDFSGVNPAWIGLTALSGTDPAVATSTQFRFDNFAVSTVPEPSALALGGVGLSLLLAFRRSRRS